MVDIHCHILPGIDDGPVSLNEALDMCRAAAADGLKKIVATPHFRPGTYEFTGRKVLDSISLLEAALRDESIGLRILPGAEIAVSPEMPAYLKSHHLTINNTGRYFLAELPLMSALPNWDVFLLSMLPLGFIPIIAHPERNDWFMNHPGALASVVDRGILVQITAMSVVGGFGLEVRDFSAFLLRHDLVHVIASDAHSADFRRPILSEAAALAAELVGQETAEALVMSSPEAIIAGKDIKVPGPAEHGPSAKGRSRKWFGRLFR